MIILHTARSMMWINCNLTHYPFDGYVNCYLSYVSEIGWHLISLFISCVNGWVSFLYISIYKRIAGFIRLVLILLDNCRVVLHRGCTSWHSSFAGSFFITSFPVFDIEWYFNTLEDLLWEVISFNMHFTSYLLYLLLLPVYFPESCLFHFFACFSLRYSLF